jgi:AraC-like DNA-binding protein
MFRRRARRAQSVAGDAQPCASLPWDKITRGAQLRPRKPLGARRLPKLRALQYICPAVPTSTRGQHLSASNRLLWPVLAAIQEARGEVASVLAAGGLDEDTAYSITADARVTLDQLYAVWSAAVEICDDEALGVRVATFVNPAAPVSWPRLLALFEHLGRAATHLGEAIGLYGRFIRLMRDSIRVQLETEGDRGIFRLDVPPEEPPALVEFNFAVALCIARRIAGRDVHGQEVWFSHPAPKKAETYAAAFGMSVRFGAPFSAVFTPLDELHRPLPHANPRLLARLVREAESLVAALPTGELFEDRVCVQIESELPDGNTNASAVASKLGVSARTLHRRLQQEGTSYQDLLDRVRQRLATRHLVAGKAIAEVAELVGFAQASTFHRAFKGWTGETPAEYQARRRAEFHNGTSAMRS